ncbi:lysophospholipid acyltransferase family protein [Sphingomonas sp. 37zxx]|uniref:lysophospholipid acyltransferase family protein n=1 Tax=Sphingomonas sp. 37zxx TaxID=1550073 RepID=UPI00053C0260|nr:1-acyl-sn-glycerol-3-phosphate acyltransferase [Sphingomonas sp. 37zxx]
MVELIDARREAAAGRPPRVSLIGWTRLWSRVAMMVLAALVTVPLHYLWRLFRLHSPWPRIFLGSVGRISGARVSRVGTPLKHNVFYVSNHVSWIDILAIGGTSGSAFVAKREIGTAPIVGWLSTLNNTVFVSREDRLGVAAQINQLRDAIAENWAITVFPEGTTTDGRSLLPFKTPMLKVLEPPPPGVRVQPVLMDFGAVGEEIAWIGAESGRDNAIRVLSRAGSFPVRVHFLEPFCPSAIAGRKAIAAESRRLLTGALEGVLGEPLRPFAGHEALGAG